MEQVFFKFHERQSNFFLNNFSQRTRSVIENTALIVAVSGFFVVAVSHITFVYRGSSVPSTSTSTGRFYIPGRCLKSIPDWKDNMDVTHVLINEWKYQTFEDEQTTRTRTRTRKKGSYAWTSTFSESNHECKEKDTLQLSCSVSDVNDINININIQSPKDEDIVLSYSRTKGFLLLPQDVQQMHNISSQYLVISKNDANCFGEPIIQKLVFYITGPGVVITNWFLAQHDGDGYIYNPKTKKITNLHHYATFINNITHSSSGPRHTIFFYKLSILLTTFFLFFMTTTLTSFILHETQNRMLKFTVLLQSHVRNRIPFTKLIFRHVVESLVFVPIMVGVLVFLMEFVFFGNTILGFGVLSLVWCGEVFSVICMRTRASIYFFPRIFFVYFTLFHVYFFSCPFGFSVTSMQATFLLLLHAMLFFLNRYEFPALQRGIISANVPRMIPVGGAAAVTATATATAMQTIQFQNNLNPPFEYQTSSAHNQNQNSSSSRTRDFHDRDQIVPSPQPRTVPTESQSPNLNLNLNSTLPRRGIERQSSSFSNATSNQSISNMSSTTSRGSPPSRIYGVVGRPTSPSGLQSHPSAPLFYADGEGEDDDSYSIFMNGEIVRHSHRTTSMTHAHAEFDDERNFAEGESREVNVRFTRESSPRRNSLNQHGISNPATLAVNSSIRRANVNPSPSESSLRSSLRQVDSTASINSINRRDGRQHQHDNVMLSNPPSLSGELIWNFNRRPRNRDRE